MDLIENELILKLLEFVELEVCFGFALSESEIRHSQLKFDMSSCVWKDVLEFVRQVI